VICNTNSIQSTGAGVAGITACFRSQERNSLFEDEQQRPATTGIQDDEREENPENEFQFCQSASQDPAEHSK